MNRVLSSGLAIGAILSLAGCGGGSSAPATAAVETGTAYYLDSAVSGINYKCGSQEGITGADGSFTFEKGQSCTFYLGDIKLRDMDKAELGDGKKIVEEDLKVAALLQSLDTDGNPDNGITIEEEVVKALATALTENGGDGTLPETAEELEAVVASLGSVEGYAGHAVSESEAEAHLAATQTEVTKELLANKTFYVVVNEDEKGWKLFEIKFNDDVTQLIETDDGPEDITITGNRMVFKNDTDGSYTIVTPMSDYILFDDRYVDGSKDGSGHYGFTSKEKAQAFLDSKTAGATDQTKELLAGKTFYEVDEDGDTPVLKIVQFNTDVTQVTITNDVTRVSETLAITIEGNKLFSDDDGYDTVVLKDGYIALIWSENSAENRLYSSKADAQAYLDSKTGGSDTDNDTIKDNKFTTTYLNGKTLYFVQYDDFGYDDEGEPGLRWNMAKMVFTTSSFTWQEYNTPDTDEHTFNYTITDDGKISYVFTEDSSDTGLISVASVENDYLKVCEEGDCNTYLFFDEAKASAFRDSHNSSASTAHYMLQEADIAGHSILVGDPQKDKQYAADHTFTSLEADVNQRDTGTWSIEDGKLKHVWSSGSVEIHSFAQKPATGVTLTNETYGATGQITEYR
jgi:hypothetical protein